MKKPKHLRSLAKAFSYRLWGSTTTVLISYFVTGSVSMAMTISGVEVFTKVFVYWTHENVWERLIPWGK